VLPCKNTWNWTWPDRVGTWVLGYREVSNASQAWARTAAEVNPSRSENVARRGACLTGRLPSCREPLLAA